MFADKNPVFRKVIIPWYNSTTIYIIMIIFMLLVFFFAVTGISVARQTPEYQGYIWVPIVLLIMSTGIVIAMTARLIKRYTRKTAK